MPGPAPLGTPSVAWTFKAGASISSSPLAVDGIVYVLGNDGVIHALVRDSGEERWQAKLGEDASASPLIADGLLIVGDARGVVHALAVADGAVRWTTATDGPISGAAAADGSVAVVATNAGTAYAIDVATGAIRWTAVVGGSVSTSVAIADGTVYVGASPNLTAISLADGTIRWTQPVSKEGRIGTPAVSAGLIFAATGLNAQDESLHGVVALDATTGLQRWRFTSPTQATIYTPAIVDGRAYIVGEDRTVVAVDAASGRLMWTTPTVEVNESVAAVADGLVFVAGNGGAVNALDADAGTMRWTVPISGIPYGPIVVDGYVIVGTNLGELVAIGGPTE
jgi:outer membrane protein assembly factor BamB